MHLYRKNFRYGKYPFGHKPYFQGLPFKLLCRAWQFKKQVGMEKGMKMIKKHWPAYAAEAVGLGGFVVGAGLLTILLEHPDLPVMNSQWEKYAMLRRVPLGLGMGVYLAGVIRLFGKQSGAHLNPAVTLTFLRLGSIDLTDALFYFLAQFLGAIGGAQLLKQTVGAWFGHPSIRFGITAPKPPYESLVAFSAEFLISFVMMLLVLRAMSSKRFEKYVALLPGGLIAFYLVLELPLSGMSLNPARSFAAALAANQYEHVWIYFVAPVSAMLLAATVFQRWTKKRVLTSNPVGQVNGKGLPHFDYQSIPTYPIEKARCITLKNSSYT